MRKPSGAEQREWLSAILQRLDNIIIKWNPRFVISNQPDTVEKADSILNKLIKARDMFADIVFPRSDSRVVIYHENVLQQLEIMEDKKLMMSYVGDCSLSLAAEQLLVAATEWQKLN